MNPSVFTPPSRTQLLADLRWLLFSPPLLSAQAFPGLIQSFSAIQTEGIERWLQDLEQDQSLNASSFGIDRHLRLGRYAERLLKYFLEHAPGFTLLAHSIALRGTDASRTTLGEIDFLLLDTDHTPCHWELAVKVFLCEPLAARKSTGPVQPHHLYGPNRAETFDLKLAKLFNTQLAQLIPHIDAHPGEVTWQRAAFAKGRIFYHFDECEALIGRSASAPSNAIIEAEVSASSSPFLSTYSSTYSSTFSSTLPSPFLNACHPQGFWCRAQDFSAMLAHCPGAQALKLERLEWLSPKTAATLSARNMPFTSADADLLHLPAMICMMKDNGELIRGFVIPAAASRPTQTPA